MIRITLSPNAEVLVAERPLFVWAAIAGLAIGLNLFYWLKRRRNAPTRQAELGLLATCLIGGTLLLGGLIALASLISEGFGWALIILVLISAVAFPYLHGVKTPSRKYAAVLIALRAASILILLLLYFEPTFKFVDRDAQKPPLIIAVDNSGSMKITDGPNQMARLDWVKSELLGRRGTLAKLKDSFDCSLHIFSDSIATISPDEFANCNPDGRSTNIGVTLGDVCSRLDKAASPAAIMFSDGIDNSGHSPVEPLTKAGVPIHAVGVGTRLRERGALKDIAVVSVDYERYIAAENKTELIAHVEGVGLNGRRVAISLKFDDKEVDNQPLVLDDFPGTQSVRLAFVPDKKGNFKCAVEIAPDPDERIIDNNKKEFDIIVSDAAIKVLLVEGIVRAEYKWLVRTLQMDPNVALAALVQVRRGVFNQQGNLKDIELKGFPTDFETLRKFNVVILGDIDRSFISREQMENLRRFADEGGGVLMLGGYTSLGPGGYDGTPVADILPVALGGKDIGQEKDSFSLSLTPDGISHPIFSGIEQFFGTGDEVAAMHVPPLLGCTRVAGLKPGATALAVHPTREGTDGKPLVICAVHRYGKGHTMVFTADTTWRWYLGLRGLGRDTPYIKMWGQALRWLAGVEAKEMDDKPGVIAYTDRRYYDPGATARIYSQVRDQQGQAANEASVTALISGPAGTPAARQLPYVPGSHGKYEVDFSPPGPGDYKMLIKAESAHGPLGTAEIEFQVGRPNIEFDVLDLNDNLLREIGENTRGSYTSIVTLDELLSKLKAEAESRRIVHTASVWNDNSVVIFGQRLSPYLIIAFTAFTALVAAEWILRKRKQMN